MKRDSLAGAPRLARSVGPSHQILLRYRYPRCRECAACSDSLMKAHQPGARIERRRRDEIHSDDERPKAGWDTFGTWPKKDIQAHIAFMMSFNKELSESGELVAAEGLAGPKQAKVVRAGKDGAPITDGVFPEAKEFLAGYWIVDVESPERAYAIAAHASAAPGTRRSADEHADRSAAGDERAARRLL